MRRIFTIRTCFLAIDDGIVVVMEKETDRLDVHEYFRRAESLRPMELVYGVVREPPAPVYGHQSIVTRLTALLDVHVRQRGLGQVCVSPVDVVLDEPRALVVQPDIVFIAADRLSIVRNRIWGPPELIVEVLSPRTAVRDRTTKLRWYRRYGVRECWLVDRTKRLVEVRWLGGPRSRRRAHTGATPIRSVVLPDWEMSPANVFD